MCSASRQAAKDDGSSFPDLAEFTPSVRGLAVVRRRHFRLSTGIGRLDLVTEIHERNRGDDGDFRETVNRYIHDFEAMLRSVLSTRDGHSLAVTLLSSDMGKLYVALAQAIERLRA